jgi:hypothetical protein
MTINWKTATHDERNNAIAEFVAGWKRFKFCCSVFLVPDHIAEYFMLHTTLGFEPADGEKITHVFADQFNDYKHITIPNFKYNANALLLLLDKHFEWSLMTDCETHIYEIRIGFKTRYVRYQGLSRSFCEAACIALLRAADVEVLT